MEFRAPEPRAWTLLLAAALLIVALWPPQGDRSLAVRFVNWAVDPAGNLPVLPPQLPFGLGDDPDAVFERDLRVQQYDAAYLRGGWTRKRLQLKVARDPLPPSITRQLLVAAAVVVAMVAWGLGTRKA